MIDQLWLSPHLDDAVLSCGGSIARACARGESILVVAVCTGSPGDVSSPFIERLYAAWGLDAKTMIPARLEEDRRALARLGADPSVPLGLLDAVYRRPSSYVDMSTLLGELAEGDDFVDEVALELAAFDARVVHAPLAAGRHVDHLAVRRAAERCFGDRVRLYEDVPYALRPGMLHTSGLTKLEVEIDVEAKIAAIACYHSQLASLFGAAEKMPDAIRAFHRSRAGFVERQWTGRPGPDSFSP